MSSVKAGGTGSSLESKWAVMEAEIGVAYMKQDRGLQKAAEAILDINTPACPLRRMWRDRSLPLPQLIGLPIKKRNGLTLSCSIDTSNTFLQCIVPHVLCLSGAPMSFSAVWKDHANR